MSDSKPTCSGSAWIQRLLNLVARHHVENEIKLQPRIETVQFPVHGRVGRLLRQKP
jgi:hypothetical protein